MDYILRATAANSNVRIFVASTKETVQKAFEIHHTTPVMTAALGRMLTACAMMGVTLKDANDLITLTVKGDGPAGGITVTGDFKARVKGCCYNNNVDIPLKTDGKLDVSGALGKGTLTVIKDMGLKEPYVGQISLVSGEIAEDITYYFAKSEQTPSAVGLGVLIDRDYLIKQSGGFIVQLLPDADEEVISSLEKKIAGINSVTDLFEKGMTAEDILSYIVGDFDYEVTEKIPVEYYCNCSRERVEKALISIGKKEISKIIEEDGHANIHCHFCNKDYEFDETALRSLII